MTHAPHHHREAFTDALDAYGTWNAGEPVPQVELCGALVPIDIVAGLLWNCTDILPGIWDSFPDDYHGDADKPVRRTYGAYARWLKRSITGRDGGGDAVMTKCWVAGCGRRTAEPTLPFPFPPDLTERYAVRAHLPSGRGSPAISMLPRGAWSKVASTTIHLPREGLTDEQAKLVRSGIAGGMSLTLKYGSVAAMLDVFEALGRAVEGV